MTPKEVDTLNVFQARMEGFKRTGAKYAIIDGNKKPERPLVQTDFHNKSYLSKSNLVFSLFYEMLKNKNKDKNDI